MLSAVCPVDLDSFALLQELEGLAASADRSPEERRLAKDRQWFYAEDRRLGLGGHVMRRRLQVIDGFVFLN